MKRTIFLFLAIVSLAGMLATSGCKKKETYMVTFNSNGGSGTMAAQTFTEGEAQALTRNAFTNEGFAFCGWNTLQDGSGASYTDGQTITATADITLYAQWTSNGSNPTPQPGNTVTVTFDANGGSGEMPPQTFTIGTPQALSASMFTREGFSYVNWNTAADGTGTAYSDSQVVTPTSSMTLYAQWNVMGGFDSNGASNALFSVRANKMVRFSRGNLWYQASTNTWRFAENQYDTIGADNTNISATNTGWIDLFGWGTGSNPTNVSTSNGDYSDFNDWGINPISNGGNQADYWRTLSMDEWMYLLEGRTNAISLVGKATVNGITGLVILPDGWTLPSDISFTPGRENHFDANTYTTEQWTKLELSGAIFLPSTGVRIGSDVFSVGISGGYWSTSTPSITNAFFLAIFDDDADSGSDYRYYGQSVRLVRVQN